MNISNIASHEVVKGEKGISATGNGQETFFTPQSLSTNEKSQIDEIELTNAINKINKEFITYDRRLEFSIHEKTSEVMVRVIDVTNDEVIREIPPEKILDMVAKLWELAGMIVDKKI